MTKEENYVCSVANLTNRLSVYGRGDVISISINKLIMKYSKYITKKHTGENKEPMARIISRLASRAEFECNDICK